MAKFTQCSHVPPSLRRQYLASLVEPQEWFLEDLVSSGAFWTHEDQTYGVIHGKTLVEFFAADPGSADQWLRDFQNQNGFSSALVKSYDRALVQSCKQLGWTGTVGGFLFRKRNPRPTPAFEGAQVGLAKAADVQSIWQINDSFFDSEDEVMAHCKTNGLWKVTVDGEIAGAGTALRVSKEGDAVDIGMMVAPDFRRKGLGTYIVSAIANLVERDGQRPICGCGAGNVASKATLEKAGFASEHQMLSFSAEHP